MSCSYPGKWLEAVNGLPVVDLETDNSIACSKNTTGNSLVVQWLELGTLTAEGPVLINLWLGN